MRYIFTLLFAAALLTAVFKFSSSQTKLKHNDISYKEALVLAKKENKPIFIMLYADWCPHCSTMKSTVLNDEKVIEFLNKNYICIWKDIEKEEGIALKKQFQTVSLPSFLFVDANETLLYRIKGKMKTDAFMYAANIALNPKMQLSYLKKQFLDDPSNSTKCLNYITTLRKGTNRKALSEPTHIYLATQSEEQLLSETNWQIISNGVTDIESREFQYVLNHKAAFEKITSPVRVENKISNIVSELLEPYTQNLDSVAYFQKRKIAQTIQLQKTDSLLFNYDIIVAERSKNWGMYKRATLEGTEKHVWNSDNKLKEIGQIYWKEINDKEALKKAITWQKRALELNNSADGNLITARLYLKIKDKKAALEYAKNAKDFATAMGWSTNDADALIKESNTK